MTTDPAILQVVNGGLTHFMTPRQRVERVLLWVVALLTACALVGVGVDNVATDNVASCVNRTLGQRNTPTALEQSALTDYANGNDAAVTQIVTAKTQAEAIAGLTAFKTTQDQFKAALAKVNSERAQAPLGKC